MIVQRLGSRPQEGAEQIGLRPQLELMGKYQLGLKSMMENLKLPVTSAAEAAMLANLDTAAGTGFDKLHMVPLYAELAGGEKAVATIDALPETEQGRVRALLRAIYQDNATLAEEDRDFLVARLGWFGELALTWGQPQDAQRLKLMDNARSTFLAVFAFAGLVFLMGFAGLALLVTILARAYLGKRPQCRFPVPDARHPGHRAWLESFALFLLIFLGLPFLAPLLPFDATPLSLLMLLAPLWLALRGFGVREIAVKLGLHPGAGLFREIGSGLVGYLAGIPIVFCGFMLTFALMKLSGEQPVHPVIFEFDEAGTSKLLGIFVLACVLAPLMEEIIFRGVFYQYLRAHLNPFLAATLCGLVFAAIHPQGWVAIPVLASIGAVFALLREWRGSLIANMMLWATSSGAIAILNWSK